MLHNVVRLWFSILVSIKIKLFKSKFPQARPAHNMVVWFLFGFLLILNPIKVTVDIHTQNKYTHSYDWKSIYNESI